MYADYVYVSCAAAELFSERHQLNLANPSVVTAALQRGGFREVRVINEGSVAPFVTGVKVAG